MRNPCRSQTHAKFLLPMAMTLALCLAWTEAPAVAQGTLFVENDRVGIGTDTPRAPLDVIENDGSARILVEEQAGTAASRTLFELINRGSVRFIFRNSDSGASYEMSSLADNFVLSLVGSGGPELIVRSNGSVTMGPGGAANFDLDGVGNLDIAGDFTANGVFYPSSRELKHEFSPVDNQGILDRLMKLPITEWSYRADGSFSRHIGPVTEDFEELFGMGTREGRLNALDLSGVTLAAIQGVNQRLEDRDQLIANLESQQQVLKSQNLALQQQNQELEKRLAALENLLQQQLQSP